jgi:hypothetical protein
MVGHDKAVGIRYLLLQFFNGIIFKLDDTIATATNQMIMMFTSELLFITHLPIMNDHFSGDTSVNKQLERPVDRRLPY